MRHNAPGGNDGLTPDVYALQNGDISADPSAGSDRDIAVILRALVFLCQFRDVLSDSIYTMVAGNNGYVGTYDHEVLNADVRHA